MSAGIPFAPDHDRMESQGIPSDEDLRSLIADVDRTLEETELVRDRAEAQLRRKPIYPERRHPKHWQRLPDGEPYDVTS
jgi:hypothetical protein